MAFTNYSEVRRETHLRLSYQYEMRDGVGRDVTTQKHSEVTTWISETRIPSYHLLDYGVEMNKFIFVAERARTC
jgi:hypothetical protein